MKKIVNTLLFSLFTFSVSIGYASQKETPPQAAVASAAPQATEAAMAILNAGGNAFDAAVAAAGVLAVVEPFHSGIGGGGFWLLHRARDHSTVFLDAREAAPLLAHRDMYIDKLGNVSDESFDGPKAAAIPGEPAAFIYLAQYYGRYPLSKTLAAAIHYAKQGFLVDAFYRKRASQRLASLQASPAAAKIFLQNNQVPELGYRIVQTDLANTLGSIAYNKRRGFYTGPLAKQLVHGVDKAGGIWRLADLKDYHVKLRPALVGKYREATITTSPPPSAGGVALLAMLNIISYYDLAKLTPAQRMQLTIEAMRLAYWDRAQYLGDPDHVSVPVGRLTAHDHAAKLRQWIHWGKATPSQSLQHPGIAIKEGNHTTHLSVLDKEGNRVAATLSINYGFGSGFVVPGTGVLLNNQMDDFSTQPGVVNANGMIGSEANAIAPGKRPLSSMVPTFIETANKLAIIGVPGGSRIPTMVLLASLDFFDSNPATSWVSVPRYHHQYLPDEVQYETNGLTPKQQKMLKSMGYKLKDLGRTYGDMQVILWDKTTHQVTAASDPRKQGQASVH